MGTVITCAQLFGIGFGLGVMGPCLFSCAPVVLAYIAGKGEKGVPAVKDILTFLSGRLAAYAALGFMAGLSGAFLQRLSVVYRNRLESAGGIITAALGAAVILGLGRGRAGCGNRHGFMNATGLFTFGMVIGLVPCAPLLAILYDIALMSKTAAAGAGYAVFFGLGTFVSGALTLGIFAGLITKVPERFLREGTSAFIVRLLCGALLILMGLGFIAGRYRG